MPSRSLRLRALPAAPVAVLGLGFFLWSDPAVAQIGAALDTAVTSLETVLRQAGTTLGVWTRQFLIGLLVLDLVWRGGKWAMSGESIAAFAEPMLYTIAIVALAWGFTTVVPDVVAWITQQATILANGATAGAGSSLTPSGMMADGIERAIWWLGAIEVWSPSTWAYLVCALIAVIVLAAELAMVILVYAEIYLVSLVGLVTLGFAGLAQTRGIATRYVMTVFGKGFKLVTLLLVVDTTDRLAREAGGLTTTGDPTLEGALAAVLLQVVGVVLIVMLPGAVERMVAGAAVGDVAGAGGKMVAGAGVSGMMSAAGAAVGGAGGAAAGAAMAAKESSSLGGPAMAKSAAIGALKGGWNWGATGREGKITSELGSRLGNRINRMGSGDPGTS